MRVPFVAHFLPVRRGLVPGGSRLALESIGGRAVPISSAGGVALELIPGALTSCLHFGRRDFRPLGDFVELCAQIDVGHRELLLSEAITTALSRRRRWPSLCLATTSA